MNNSPKEDTKLTDRLAVGALSGIAAFLTGTFIWFVVFYSLSMVNIEYEPSFIYVVIFSILMFVLGFATLTNVVTNILGAIWHFLYRSLRIWE